MKISPNPRRFNDFTANCENLVLWHGQSWFRKGLEVPTTALMEIFWSKERILEVYLNIAEFGNGIFGVEAASRYYSKISKEFNSIRSGITRSGFT